MTFTTQFPLGSLFAGTPIAGVSYCLGNACAIISDPSGSESDFGQFEIPFVGAQFQLLSVGSMCDTNCPPPAPGDPPVLEEFSIPITLDGSPNPVADTLTVVSSAAVPEPSSIVMVFAGLAGIGLFRRRSRNK